MDIKSIKELIKTNVYEGFKTLHDIFGFNYLKPYGLYHIAGRFTFNQIEKMIAADGYTINNSVIAVLVRDPSHAYSNKFHLIRYNGSIDIDFKIYRYTCEYRGRDYNREIDTFYRKSDLESMRKRDTAETIIIVQLVPDLHMPTPKKGDYNYLNRFNINSDIDISYSGYNGKSYINGITIKDYTDGHKISREYIGRVFYTSNASNGRYKTDIRDIIDKSGYFVDDRRENLKRRAAALKAEREKAAFIAADNTEKIDSLYRAILSRRDDIISILSHATTAADFKRVEDIFNRWNGFADIVSDYERLKARDAAKEYSSMESFNKVYNDLVNRLDTILEKGV